MNERLPKCVYKKHNAYYLVKKNVWTNLGADYATAIERAAAMQSGEMEMASVQKFKTFHPSHKHKAKVIDETLRGLPADIVGSSIPRPVSGIYFLILGEQIVYVGQSINILQRVGMHAATKEFDRYYYFECAQEHLDSLEAYCIHKFCPTQNISRPDVRRFKGLRRLKGFRESFGV